MSSTTNGTASPQAHAVERQGADPSSMEPIWCAPSIAITATPTAMDQSPGRNERKRLTAES